MQIASYITAQLGELGLNIQINTVDISTLLSVAGTGEFDMLAVTVYIYASRPLYRYKLAAVGRRMDQVLQEEVAQALEKTQRTTDMDEIVRNYRIVTGYTQEDVPMITAYVLSAIGAVNNRLKMPYRMYTEHS